MKNGHYVKKFVKGKKNKIKMKKSTSLNVEKSKLTSVKLPIDAVK
ncbi:protein of unknown function [Petrocella atlantisensis]|uniref:Uncharacterized protein n=1 Tax=Petrocella atlantisensis TaxID=2173034 RepID=A0A3P7PRR4_9FIRM|nr:hypothetical protein [Petrocella atlantisensis]VDN46907.1 protein of unknown function [Petrocella atlantisensis]